MHGIHNIKLDSSGAVIRHVKNTTKFNFMTQQLKVQTLQEVLCHGVFNTAVLSVLLEKSHDGSSMILVTGPARDSQSAAPIAELLPLTVAVMTVVLNLLHHFHLCYPFGKVNNASSGGRAGHTLLLANSISLQALRCNHSKTGAHNKTRCILSYTSSVRSVWLS